MKVTTILIFLLGFFAVASAQNCDIAQTGVAVFNADNTARVSSITMGEDAIFKFSIANFGSALGCSIPANSITTVFNFPTLAGGIKPYIYDGPTSFSSGYFSWVYDPATEILRGTNTASIPNGLGDIDIQVRVKGNAGGTAISNLNLVPAMGAADNAANNNSSAQLIVLAGPVPIKLSAFNVKADKCNALLTWKTLTESNFGHFDVEYSPDGITYIKIGTVNGRNSATGSAYEFSYNQLSGIGYYRLGLVDRDGMSEYSAIVHTVTNCKEQAKILVYPNPVSTEQKLLVDISGYQGKMAGVLFTDAAQKAGSFDLVNGSNSVSVSSLAPGIYMLRVYNESKEVASFKVIVTN